MEDLIRILIFSDNHGDKDNISRIIDKNQPLDRIISLGDSEMREKELTDLGIFGVKGNYPFEPKFPYELDYTFFNWRILFVHGHLYRVKSGLTKLLQKAYYEKFDLVCFGHTHRTFLEDIEDIIMLNPGSLSSWRSNENPTYAIIELSEEKCVITIKNVFENVIKQYEKVKGNDIRKFR
ncbi:MAG: YfcE family phosphodiesterase [Tenericutes bacterium HGW-Tenericutes-5]|nr:MAG: YfcE family phosphodiesterase [Tenericutes bacterium HGW-Tenericutes-5]